MNTMAGSGDGNNACLVESTQPDCPTVLLQESQEEASNDESHGDAPNVDCGKVCPSSSDCNSEVNSQSEGEGDGTDKISDTRASSDEDGPEAIASVNNIASSTTVASTSTNRPPINIRIPTAFLASQQKSSSSHHVYQIYIRIEDEEWNVYRRYSQFYALNKYLRKKYPILRGLSKDFPPKITIGNRDAKVVQERRKKLESYLKAIVNVFQAEYNIIDKRTLVLLLPFLEDKKIERKASSDSHLDPALSSSSHLSQCYVGY